MKRLYPCFLLVAALFAPVIALAQAQPADPHVREEIRDLRDRWIAAEERKDIPYLNQLLADDCVIGNSQGQVLDKTHFLERIGSPDRTLGIRNTRDVEIRLFGDTAVLTEEITVNGVDHGHAFGGDFRFVRVFHRHSGQWKVILGQGTPIRTSQ